MAEERLPARAAISASTMLGELPITVLAEALRAHQYARRSVHVSLPSRSRGLSRNFARGPSYGLFACEAAWALWQRSAIPKSRAHPWSLSKQRAAELRISKSTVSARRIMADVIDVDEAEATDISTPVLETPASLGGRTSNTRADNTSAPDNK